MSTHYYARKKEPRIVYDEFEIGNTSNGTFHKMYADFCDDTMYFNTLGDLIEFVEKTERYDFVDEYGKEHSRENMLKIIKGENSGRIVEK